MSDLTKIIEGVQFFTNTIVSDMQRQFGQPRLRCHECGRVQFGTWEYLKTGWPKHHGQTMRLETVEED